jgi:uncharacterized protein (DUF2147 family)
MQTKLLWVLILGLQVPGPASSESLGDVSGIWRTGRYGALVQIGDCGNATPCGRLNWVDPRITEGATHDVRNRDPAQRGRDLMGLPVLWGFALQSEGWRDGRLYNPDDGKTFRAHLGLVSPNELRVTGCLGPLCRSEIWKRSATQLAARERE